MQKLPRGNYKFEIELHKLIIPLQCENFNKYVDKYPLRAPNFKLQNAAASADTDIITGAEIKTISCKTEFSNENFNKYVDKYPLRRLK